MTRRLLAILAILTASITAIPLGAPAQPEPSLLDYITDCLAEDCRSLDLSSNQLTGSIPPEIGNLTNLQDLNLSYNRLTGSIPPEIGNLTNLQDLNLSYNQLTGSIPPEIGNLTNLQVLDLSRNRLTGPIPPELANLTGLKIRDRNFSRTLDLSRNRLTGPIPPELFNLTGLDSLDLSRNRLTGPIPPELANLTNLYGAPETSILDLSRNRLTGPIPPELANIPEHINALDLSRNQLTGPIPPELMGVFGHRFYFLDLSHNQLTGPIPEPSTILRNMDLDLRCNELTGPIPEKLRKIWRGQIQLNEHQPKLRGNMLTGPAHYELLKPTCVFDDIEGSVHETNIDLIAVWGITTGCERARFCPSRTVTRAQMAAFLYRAAEHLYGAPATGSEVRLSDVAADAFYQPAARWAVANGVIRAPGGNFDPGGAVTRADMAEMLVGAFAHLSAPDRAEGLFTDMAGLTDGAVRAVEGIAAAEVTTGCAAAPRRYCPDKTVTRAQMASFLARAVQSAP